ncbi:MAG: hypothetical protein COT43_08585 [Candidatus Marinimicrobia bacterium CG08_land_8_20_14_0_20_45_22]|nr:MAG: hypothetical protein COT43_08585 [Candidatus Marinimicrobia bacterium CG08_land_8_20_14_0_20_45_22]
MSDLLKKILYAGIGAAAVTKEKAEEIVEELVKKGEITKDESKKALADVLKSVEKRKGDVEIFVKEEISKGLKKLDIPTREEFDELKKKVEARTKKK